MEYKTRSYPRFAACGLNCGLCPRYYTAGTSRCPGCSGEGFSNVHPPCGILSCCQRKELEYCFECDEFPCKKYEGIDKTDSFITHKNQITDLEKAKRIGIETYKAKLDKKISILETLLRNHDNGRLKSFFCLTVNLLDLEDIYPVMDSINNETDPKTIVQLFEKTAERKGVSLKLRK